MASLIAAPSEAQQRRSLKNVERLLKRARMPAQPGDPGGGVRSVGIVGAGMMGRAIAAAHLTRGLPVVLTDSNAQALSAAPGRIAAELADDWTAREAAPVNRLLQTTGNPADVARCDLVLETINEDLGTKLRLFAELEPAMADWALLVSNTSTIPITRLAAGLSKPERFCGFHFLHPVRERPLVEVIRGEKTSQETIQTAAAHARAIGRTPIVVADGPSFLVNRLLFPCLGESLQLLVEGVPIEVIDRAALRFGFAKGPLELIDEIGLDVTLHSAVAAADAFGDRMPRSPLLVAMLKAGRLGCKAGRGFYTYRETPGRLERREPDDDVRRLIDRWTETAGEHTDQSIVERLVLPMVLEATRALDDGIAGDPRDVDLVVLLGLGFPHDRGGLLWWADGVGADAVLSALQRHAHAGLRFEPTPMLLDMARDGRRFYRTDEP